jgi:hypothetical protein
MPKESGRSIGGVYICMPCAVWIPPVHELVRLCDTKFTKVFRKLCCDSHGHERWKWRITSALVCVNGPECLRAVV